MRAQRLLAAVCSLLLLAAFLACAGPDSPRSQVEIPDMSQTELDDRGTRMHQPKLKEGTRVVLRNPARFAKGKVKITLGENKPKEAEQIEVDNETTATVIDDPDVLFQVKVRFTSGPYDGKVGHASKGDMFVLGEPKRSRKSKNPFED